MKKFSCFFLLVLLAVLVQATGNFTLDKLNKPQFMAVYNGKLFIAETAVVYIYSLEDGKLLSTFGKAGEGPREFPLFPGTCVRFAFRGEEVIVFSVNRVSFFKMDGTFLREIKTVNMMNRYLVLDDKYLGLGLGLGEKQVHLTINLYDDKFAKSKELANMEFVSGGKIRLLARTQDFNTYDGKVFVTGEQEFIIHVLDAAGQSLYDIKPDYRRLSFTNETRDEIYSWYKTNPITRSSFDQIKQNLLFPNDLPAVRTFYISAGKLYVQTFKRKEGKTEFLIFDVSGKSAQFLKTVWLTIHSTNPIEEFQLFTITDGKLVQLEEIDEEWELQISDVN